MGKKERVKAWLLQRFDSDGPDAPRLPGGLGIVRPNV